MKRRPLRREIAVLLTIKLIALAAIWYGFFRPETRVPVDPRSAEQHLFEGGPGPSNSGG